MLYYAVYNILTAIFEESWLLWFSVQIVSTLVPFCVAMVSTYWVLSLENEMSLTGKLDNYYEMGEKSPNQETGDAVGSGTIAAQTNLEVLFVFCVFV